MKKVILGVIFMAAMGLAVNADAKGDKKKKECPKTEQCCKEKTKAAAGEKKECCSKKEAGKKCCQQAKDGKKKTCSAKTAAEKE